METRRRFQWSWWMALLITTVWGPTAVLATPPSTPITIELRLSHMPQLHERAVLTVEVRSIFSSPETQVELVVPEGIDVETTSWVADLEANVPATVTTGIFLQKPGNWEISARALKVTDSGAIWGDMKSIPLYVNPGAAAGSEMGWQVDQVPVAMLAKRGNTDSLSMEPTPFSFLFTAAQAPDFEQPPSVEPVQASHAWPALPGSPGTVTLVGKWRYTDRSNIARDIDQQLIEIRRGDGSALNPRAFCWTAVDGSFSCSSPHPGTTMRVRVWSYAEFSIPGATNRLGVFAGPEVLGGCGSDAVNCSYPMQTGEIACANGATCDIGTWTVTGAEPWLGAHQMTQDLIRSWKKLWFDTKHPTGTSAGPGRIQYPVPAGHGTHAHVGNGKIDGWISIEPPGQQSADLVVHEYGHVVMANLWAGYTPVWPTLDCPSPHFIQIVSGPGCALSEGFANFWAWYSNEFYDGDDSTANDGPIFNWPGGALTDLETRDGDTYQSGDQVEGNIAASLGDLYDLTNEGPTLGPADRLSDGIQHIWHTLFSQSDNNFSEWWNSYWAAFGHAPCPALDILQWNTLPYVYDACAQTSADVDGDGFSIAGGDCNDTNAAIHPGAAEVCNNIDDNCNGQVDEGLSLDADGDGFSPPTSCAGTRNDCNDNDAVVHPGAVEICNNVDENCDSQVDEGVKSTFYRDADGDGYGNAAGATQACNVPSGYVANNADCNDANVAIHPGATELCNNSDDDCDGQIDEGVSCAPSVGTFLDISTRGLVGTGDNVMIGGFVIEGSPMTVLIRAIGPSLALPPFNVAGVLANPMVQLFAGQTLVATNDDWQTDANASAIPVGLRPSNSLEAALLVTLDPGAYTGIVRGVGNTTGVALVEVIAIR